jgi:cysteine desulfurase/selenocysteine lyase
MLTMNPEKIRRDFPIFQRREDLVYLDNAATSQKPEKVIQAVKDFYSEKNSNIGRGIYDLAGDATQAYEGAREKVAEFIGAGRDEVVFVRNTTEAENLLADSLEFEGKIVLSEMAHHSEQLPWRRKAEEESKEVEFMETEDGKISRESAREKISENTGLVAVSHVSNVFGAENPIKEITEIAHENNALVVLDVAQSAPNMPLDVEELGVDFLCFSGHKILGPTGIGVLYGRKNLFKEMKPYQAGGGMIERVEKDKVDYTGVPERLEAGTPNIAGAIGLGAAVEYLEEIGMRKIYSHDRRLADKMMEGLKEIKGIRVVSPEDASLVSFTAEYAHPHDVAEILNKHGVAVRAGHHCAQPQMEKMNLSGTVRASPYLYNTERDVKRFLDAVEKAREVFS